MSHLRLSYFGLFKELTGKGDEPYEGNEVTLEELVESLGNKYGSDFRQAVMDTERGPLLNHSTVLVNGQQRPLTWALADNDEVVFLSAFAGGSGGEWPT